MAEPEQFHTMAIPIPYNGDTLMNVSIAPGHRVLFVLVRCCNTTTVSLFVFHIWSFISGQVGV